MTPWTAACQASLFFTVYQRSNSYPLGNAIEPSVVPFSCPKSFSVSGSFPMSRLFPSNGQSIGAGASASASVFPMNVQDWFPLGLTDLIFLLSKGLSRVFSSTTVQKHQFFTQLSFSTQFFMVKFSHPHMTTGKPIALTIGTFDSKVMSLVFYILSRFVIVFLPSSKWVFLFFFFFFHGCCDHPQWFWSQKI